MALIKCEECGQMISDKAVKCPKCGAPIEKKITCEECGQLVPKKASCCPYCGCPMQEDAGTKGITNKVNGTMSKGKRLLLAVCACIVLALVAGAGVMWWPSNKSEKVVEITPKFSEAIQKYDMLSDYHEGLAGARNSLTKKWGFIDTKGKEVIQCQYEDASYFADGLAPVMDNNGKYGYINKKGMVVVPFIYAYALPYSEGIAIATVNGNWMHPKLTFLDDSGNVIEKLSNMNLRGFIYEEGETGSSWFEANSFYKGVSCSYVGNGDKDDVDWNSLTCFDKQGNVVVDSSGANIEELVYEITDDGIVDKNGVLIASYPKSAGYSLSYSITYDGKDYHSTPNINNGVILAELQYLFYDWEHEDIRIYGYVDLEGNTTFTEEDFAKIKKVQMEGH